MKLKLKATLLFQITLILNIIACSYSPESFCAGYSMAPDDLIVSGQIIAIDSDGITLKVLQVLRGEEEKDTIRVWDGTDFDCNGFFSMAASDLGEMNDTLLVILPKIEMLENTWDVIGDYRRPEFMEYTSSLSVQNGTITGLIQGLGIAPPSVQITSMDYTSFINTWTTTGDCSNISVSTEEIEKKPIEIRYNNPVKEYLDISVVGGSNTGNRIKIYTGSGKQIKTEILSYDEVRIDFSRYPRGVYYVKVEEEKHSGKILKIVKI